MKVASFLEYDGKILSKRKQLHLDGSNIQGHNCGNLKSDSNTL
jgi:hypothetical protein